MKYELDVLYNNGPLWQMSSAERLCFLWAMHKVNPSIAVEVGSYTGGSLQHSANHFEKVYSIDINHSRISGTYQSELTLITGDSVVELPELVDSLQGQDVTFWLIDGNHEYDYVKSDLNNVLLFKPKSETIVLLHDSWYEPSRRAILDSNLKNCPYVHFVDLDFCHGEYVGEKLIMGGLCLIVMKPEIREGELEIKRSSNFTYERIG